MSNNESKRGWQPGGQIAVGHDLEGNVVFALQGESGSLVRVPPQQALALATAVRATARRLMRREASEEDGDE